MMKKIVQLALDMFVRNAAGWILTFVNFAIISFLTWTTADMIHTQMPLDDKPYKISIISSYNPNGNALADFAMLVIFFINLPAFYLSNLFYQTFFVSSTESFSTIDKNCKFCWFYVSQVGCDIFFITIQWLVIGFVVKKLCKLVKDS